MSDAARAITLTFAPDAGLLRVVRLAASSMANDAGFSVSEIDDLTLAVDELTAGLLDVAGAELSVTITADGNVISVEGRSTGTGVIELNEIATLIVERTTDGYQVEIPTTSGPSYRMTKRHVTVG